MQERNLQFSPESDNFGLNEPKIEIEIKRNEFETIKNVVFEKQQQPDGSVIFKNNTPGRKAIILHSSSIVQNPETGKTYDVQVVNDTKPRQPSSGKLYVRIIDPENVPIGRTDTEKRVETTNLKPLPLEVDIENGRVLILETELPLNTESPPYVPQLENFSHFTLDRRTLQVIEKIATAVELGEPCLLEGETATSKTSSIEYLAAETGNGVLRLNLNGQSDTSELIGKFVPNDGQLQIEFEQLLSHQDTLSEQSRKILESANKAGRGLTLIESQKIAEAEGIKVPEWKWKDGLDIEAKRKGVWLILDEINLAEPQILERLNSQLEKNPSITLTENDGTQIRRLTDEETELYKTGKLSGVEPLHKNFRIFATMNPAEYAGRRAMSPAYKDRWTSYINVERPSEDDYRAMMELMVYGEQPEVTIGSTGYRGKKTEPKCKALGEIQGMRGFLAKLAKFESTTENLARESTIGKGRKEQYIFTRRGLIEFLSYLEHKSMVDRKTGKRVTIADDPKRVVLSALKYYFTDKIATADDRKKLEDSLDAIGIGNNTWTHIFKIIEKKMKEDQKNPTK